MEDDKMFDLMSKIYSELQETKKEMHEGFEKVDTRLTGVEEDLNDVKSELSDVKRTVINIEHTHGQKLEALFDGYTQNSQQLDRIEKEVTKHEEIILRRIK